MPGKIKAVRKRANRRTGQLAGKSRPGGRSISAILLKFQQVFPRQSAVELALRTGADVRHCERCLAGTRALGPEFLIALLRSDFGPHAWTAIMQGCDQPWFSRIERLSEIANMRRKVGEVSRAIERLEREAGE